MKHTNIIIFLIALITSFNATAEWQISSGFKFPITLRDKNESYNAKQAIIKLTVPSKKEFIVKRQFYNGEMETVWFPDDFKGIAGYILPGLYKWEIQVDNKLILESGFEILPIDWKVK